MERFCLILGFFDGVHKGHEAVIKSAVEYAKKNDSKTVLITFKTSPSEYFAKGSEYIYTRELSYELMYKLGVDIIKERNFADLSRPDRETKTDRRKFFPTPPYPCFPHGKSL